MPSIVGSSSLLGPNAGPGTMIATAAETILGLLLVLGWKTRIAASLSGLLLITFALTMTLALGVKAPLNLSVFSAAGGHYSWELVKKSR
jgi:uncharacterized membrane protein YphA (DoxX/SURF4 family)